MLMHLPPIAFNIASVAMFRRPRSIRYAYCPASLASQIQHVLESRHRVRDNTGDGLVRVTPHALSAYSKEYRAFKHFPR